VSSIEAEQQRVAIFERLVEKLGPEQAHYIMDNHPPGGWEQFATKEDLKRFATKEDLEKFAEKFATKEDLKALETSTKINLQAGLDTVRAEMREGFATVHLALAGIVEQTAKASERRASVFYANFLTLLVLCVAIVSVVVSLN